MKCCVIGSVTIFAFMISTTVSAQWTREKGLRIASDFELTELYRVPAAQGSWVSLTCDPDGRLIASDQYGKLYRVTIDGNGKASLVEPILLNTGRAHGLLYAFDALYVMSHEGDGQPSGLYRVTDSDGDDNFDRVELLRQINGSGEHGPHAIILSPDKKSLFICAGNHTQLPEIVDSRVPRNWQEDQLLPRMWDAGGHAVGILAPGGWVIKTDPEGKAFELISSGFRNQYDIAFDENGELFTYDADMEWDVGLPWYRPTRICHLTSGSEFGWRSGSGKWPEYYADSLPAACDIGTASPTGVTFGTGAKFPAKYQRALFACDWSFGVIYAVHLNPSGASFKGEREVFCTAPGLAVTDVVIRPTDGAMYFLIGGRKSQSALFRIEYRGSESTEPAESTESTDLAKVRRHLESLHSLGAAESNRVIEDAWAFLKHSDRFVRYAARVAIERMPVETWSDWVWKEFDNQTTLEAAMALARCGKPADQQRLIEKLLKLDWKELSTEQRLHLMRDVGLVLTRMGEANSASRQAIVDYFDPHLPATDTSINFELVRLLVAVQSSSVASKGMALLAAGKNQEEQIHYAYCLRCLQAGWTPDLRTAFFQWFLDSGAMKGGNSFNKYLENMRAEHGATLNRDDMKQFASWVTKRIERSEPKPPEATRPLVKKWEMTDFADAAAEKLSNRNLENGQKMFVVGQCYNCHRISGSGGSVGPDLTPSGRRFNVTDLLETLIVPSKEVSDQYQATVFQLNDGRLLTGRIANLNGDTYMVQTNMLDPGSFTNINAKSIEEMQPSKVSMMPTGLLDTMSREDILDLLAYLQAASDAAMGGVR